MDKYTFTFKIFLQRKFIYEVFLYIVFYIKVKWTNTLLLLKYS